MSPDSGEESQIKKDEWPEFFIRLFPDDVGVFYAFPNSSSHSPLTGISGPKQPCWIRRPHGSDGYNRYF
jgi:hypothetical protein